MEKVLRSRIVIKCLLAAIALVNQSAPAIAQNGQNQSLARSGPTQGIYGQVLDQHGRSIPGATVTLQDAGGTEQTARTDTGGTFNFPSVEPRSFTLDVTAENFSPYHSSLTMTSRHDQFLKITLRVGRRDEITVLSGNPMFRGAEYSGGSFVLSGQALESMPEGPGGLEAVLRSLALRTAGPFGPQILVNGFGDNPLPLTHSIREVRVSDNPFSAEYPQLGLGLIEILTKPGTEKFHGQGSFGAADAVLNTRNPFASNQAPYRSWFFGGNLGGPLYRNKATFFTDFSRQTIQSNAVINAVTLTPTFGIAPLGVAVVSPQDSLSFAPRVDYQLNAKNTLVARYSFSRSHDLNSGVGEFSLASRALNLTRQTQTVQLTETAMLNTKTINETRFQFIRNETSKVGDNSMPTISVPGAFTGGGAEIGLAFDNEKRWELQNYLSLQANQHFIKAGVQFKYVGLDNGSTQNFGGTYTFNGGLAPQLNSANQIVMSGGSPVLIPITSIEAYRRTQLFRSLGFSPQAIRQLGGGASQFSLAAGQINTALQQYQLGLFAQEDWRISPKFSLHGGLRFEHQTNLPSDYDFAPRLALAWGLGRGQGQPKTVLHAGVGLFYDRVGERIVLRALQLNGVNQQQFFTTDTSVLDFFPGVPSLTQLSRFTVPQSIVRLSPDIRVPYTAHASVSIEHQFPNSISLDVTYARVRSLHLLRSRDINAPRPGTKTRPDPNAGEIFAYESSGKFNQNQLLTNLVYRGSKKVTLWTTYTLSDAMSDTDGPDTFPANSYNLAAEYGRSAMTARHTLYTGGWINAPGKLELTPLILWRTGLPFNITTGRDNSGDSLFMARPSFAAGLTGPNIVISPLGAFNLNPAAGQQIIPRNFGTGPSFLIANLRVSRTFRIHDRASVIVAVQGQNILNHPNAGLPIGSLASPLFGVSNTAAGDWGQGTNQAGNRRLELWLFFQF